MMLVGNSLFKRNSEQNIKKSSIVIRESQIKTIFHFTDIKSTPTAHNHLIILHIHGRITIRNYVVLEVFDILSKILSNL